MLRHIMHFLQRRNQTQNENYCRRRVVTLTNRTEMWLKQACTGYVCITPNKDDANSRVWVEWPTPAAEVYCSLRQRIDIHVFDETLFCLEVNGVRVYR